MKASVDAMIANDGVRGAQLEVWWSFAAISRLKEVCKWQMQGFWIVVKEQKGPAC
jgi:hypothetical protein